MKTVYIVLGAARSGSTILTKAIGGNSKCFGLGEINRFNHEINNHETHCGCAAKLADCQFWKDILLDLGEITNSEIKGKNSNFKVGIFKQLTKKNKIYSLILTIFFKKKYLNKNVDDEIKNTIILYKTIFSKTKASVLIDSTKGLFRALVLASRSDEEIQFKFIQLTRDGRGVLNSSLKSTYSITHKDGVSREYEGKNDINPSKIITSWLYVNLRNYIILKLFNKNKSVFIRYEDFTSDPSKYLKKIYAFVNLDYEDTALNLGSNENHILGGNASRINAKKIKKQDDSWRKNLDKNLLNKFNRKAGWFNKLLGYE